MKFILLTDSNGDPVMIQIDKIVTAYIGPGHGTTVAMQLMDDPIRSLITETPAEILKLIEEAHATE